MEKVKTLMKENEDLLRENIENSKVSDYITDLERKNASLIKKNEVLEMENKDLNENRGTIQGFCNSLTKQTEQLVKIAKGNEKKNGLDKKDQEEILRSKSQDMIKLQLLLKDNG